MSGSTSSAAALEAIGLGEGDSGPRVRSAGMTDELEALQWLSVDELAAARRRAIWKLNLLDRSADDYPLTVAALERTMDLIGQVQDGRRRRYY